MGVYIPIKDYSAMQGPAPSGFHVPSKDEWTALYSILTTTLGLTGGGNLMKSYLKAPFAGIREGSTSNVKGQGSYGYFWLSTPGTSNLASEVYFTPSSITNYGDARSKAFTIRCFKNSPVSPDNTWTTLYDGSGIAAGAGIFHNTTLGLISISGDGLTWITIADKNLGATTVYNDGDTLSEANCGYYYQRGNNYGFAWTGSVTTSSTIVDASNYGPGNYYNSNTFITNSGNWDSSNNANLWGGVTGAISMSELKNAYIGIPFPESIILDKSSISLITIGQTEQLTATIEPDVCDKSITWSSDDTTVATVSTTGLVTCVTPGSCTITATTVNGLTASCSVAQGRLPSAYQEVEYIQSSGTQWIDTGLYADQDTVVETKWNLVQYNSNVSWDKFYGTYGSNGTYCFFLQSNRPDDYRIRTVNYSNNSNTRKINSLSAITTGTDYTVKHSATEFWLNGVLQGSCSTISYTSPSTITIFALHDGSSVLQNVYLKLYYFKMYSGETLERDFVPCYRIADSVIGLYDIVNNQFYTNNGSGTFTKGADVN